MIATYTKLLLDFKSIPKQQQRRTFLEIAGYPHYENVCSNILQFYLNPANEHGLNQLVLHCLLQIAGVDVGMGKRPDRVTVHREYSTLNGSRLDLLLLTDSYVIGIENKVFHHLHNDLSEYYNTVKSMCNSSKAPICIVLSLNKLNSPEDLKKIRDNHFVNITYEQLFAAIRKNLGMYLDTDSSYLYHLMDFIKSIENLTPKTMEDKTLWAFFKNNTQAIEELTDSFQKYRNSLLGKAFQLKAALPREDFAPSADQWIWKSRCLVHDYVFQSKYEVAIDTYCDIGGWRIEIFGRNAPSNEFALHTLSKATGVLHLPYESDVKGERLIYQKFDVDTDVAIVAKSLGDLLSNVERYKNEVADPLPTR